MYYEILKNKTQGKENRHREVLYFSPYCIRDEQSGQENLILFEKKGEKNEL